MAVHTADDQCEMLASGAIGSLLLVLERRFCNFRSCGNGYGMEINTMLMCEDRDNFNRMGASGGDCGI